MDQIKNREMPEFIFSYLINFFKTLVKELAETKFYFPCKSKPYNESSDCL